MSAVFDLPMQDMTAEDGRSVSKSAAAFVLLALADHANDDGENVYPSEALIARKTKLSDRTVVACISALVQNGYITYCRTSRLKTNEYTINVDVLTQTCQDDTQPVMVTKPDLSRRHEPHVMVTEKPSVNHQIKPLISSKGKSYEVLTREDIDDEGNPITKPQKRKTVKSNLAWEIAHAIADVCRVDFDMNQTRLLKEANVLAKKDTISPELIRQMYQKGGAWYKLDWRGKKGELPRPELIKETFIILRKTESGLSDIVGDVRDRG